MIDFGGDLRRCE